MSFVQKIVIGVFLGFLVLSSVLGVAVYKYLENKKAKSVKIVPAEEQTITVVEGWSTDDLAFYLEKNKIVGSGDFEKSVKRFNKSSYDFLSSVPSGQGLEGYLFPDTYRILKKSTPDQIIERLLGNFEKKISTKNIKDYNHISIPGYENLSGFSGGLTLHQVLTLASIVEKETGIDLGKMNSDQRLRLREERKVVAGIFLNRLSVGQALESDATINFITKKNIASPSLKDLEVNSPYNTYKYPGLPLGPICSPSLESIEAVLNPTKTDFFFFLHKQPSGEAVYSRTFQEHVNNKLKYLK